MARRKKNGTGEDAEGTMLEHNSAARADYENSKFAEWYDLDKGIDHARETHLRPLSAARTKLRRDMKADLDMHQEDIKVAYAVYKRRREATEWDDQGEADKVHDSLRELFVNLQAGGQLDFLNAIKPGDEDDDVRPEFLKDKTESRKEEAAQA